MAATGWPIFGLLHLAQAGERQTTGVFFCERAAIFFMDTGEGAGDAGAAAVQNRVESHATSGVSPLGAWPC